MKTELRVSILKNEKNTTEARINKIVELVQEVKRLQPIDVTECLEYLEAEKNLIKVNNIIKKYNDNIAQYHKQIQGITTKAKFKFKDILTDYTDDDIEIEFKSGGFVLPQLWFYVDRFEIDENTNEVFYEGVSPFSSMEWSILSMCSTTSNNRTEPTVNLLPNIEQDLEKLVYECTVLEGFAVLEREKEPNGDNPQVIKSSKALKKMLDKQEQQIKENIPQILKMYEYILEEVFATKQLIDLKKS